MVWKVVEYIQIEWLDCVSLKLFEFDNYLSFWVLIDLEPDNELKLSPRSRLLFISTRPDWTGWRQSMLHQFDLANPHSVVIWNLTWHRLSYLLLLFLQIWIAPKYPEREKKKMLRQLLLPRVSGLGFGLAFLLVCSQGVELNETEFESEARPVKLDVEARVFGEAQNRQEFASEQGEWGGHHNLTNFALQPSMVVIKWERVCIWHSWAKVSRSACIYQTFIHAFNDLQ